MLRDLATTLWVRNVPEDPLRATKVALRLGVLGRVEIMGSDNLRDGLGTYSDCVLRMGCLLDLGKPICKRI